MFPSIRSREWKMKPSAAVTRIITMIFYETFLFHYFCVENSIYRKMVAFLALYFVCSHKISIYLRLSAVAPFYTNTHTHNHTFTKSISNSKNINIICCKLPTQRTPHNISLYVMCMNVYGGQTYPNTKTIKAIGSITNIVFRELH